MSLIKINIPDLNGFVNKNNPVTSAFPISQDGILGRDFLRRTLAVLDYMIIIQLNYLEKIETTDKQLVGIIKDFSIVYFIS